MLDKDILFNLLHNLPIGLMLVSPDFKVIFINKLFKNLLDIRTEINNINDFPDFLDDFKRFILDNAFKSLSKDIFIKTPNAFKYFEISITSFISSDNLDNKTISISLINKTADIKKLDSMKAMQDELFQFKDLAAIGTMISGIAHELNNPISGISMSSQMIEKSIRSLSHNTLSNEINEEFEYILSELDFIKLNSIKSAKLIDGLLNYSKKDSLELQHCHLLSIINETITLTKSQSVFNKSNIFINCDENITLNCDKLKIQQVLYNILKNAAESFENHGVIKVDCKIEDLNIHISLSDNGCGINSSDLNQLFIPFFTTKSHKGGTGLGLSISNRIIEKHNGKIIVNSQINKGTNFLIILPRNLK